MKVNLIVQKKGNTMSYSINNLTLKFIYALYNNPIYKNCDYDEAGNVKAVSDFKENIDIAIVGFGEYGRKLL